MTTEPTKLRVVRPDFDARSEELQEKLAREMLPEMLDTYCMLNDAINKSSKTLADTKTWLKKYLRDHPSAEPFLEGKGTLVLKDGATRWNWDLAGLAEKDPELLLTLAKAGCFSASPMSMDTVKDLQGKGVIPNLTNPPRGEHIWCFAGANEPSLAWEKK